MNKEKIKTIGLKILEDLKVTDYYQDREPTIVKRTVTIWTENGNTKREEGWKFVVSAPNWQFDNDQGVYGITLFLDGTPHSISDGTGGRGLSAFVYLDTDGKYKAVSKLEDLPK